MPVVCSDTYRPFPMSLEFESVPDYKSFMMSAEKTAGMDQTAPGAPMLEIQQAGTGKQAVQTRVFLDTDTEMLRLDTIGDAAAPNMKYNGTVHFGNDKKKVVLTTGNKIG